MPDLVVIAGPNGAGKSTVAPRLLKRFGVREFVNADDIARGLSAFAPETVAIDAGRIMLKRLDALARAGKDFAFETTLATRSFAPWIARLRRDRHYRFQLTYLWLPAAEEAVRRVAERVRLGGHDVPADAIQRRWQRGISNLRALYLPIADSWAVYDNSSQTKLVARRDPGGEPQIVEPEAWRMIEREPTAKERERPYRTGAERPGMMGVPFEEITDVLQQAVRDAWRRHKALGHPIVIWRDGRVVDVPPEQIEV